MKPKSSRDETGKENIQVYLRLRPQNEAEVLADDCKIWDIQDTTVRVNTHVYDELISQNSK